MLNETAKNLENLEKLDAIKSLKTSFIDKKNQTYLILCHTNPDGDVLGAALAMKFLLENYYGKKAFVYSKDFTAVSTKFDFLPGVNEINVSDTLPVTDVTILLECSNIERTGYKKEDVKSPFLINIDHHTTNDNYADINWVESNRAAVCEMIFYLNKIWGKELDYNTAICLYVGILTDTGRFQYSNMTSHIYDILKELVATGIDINFVYRKIYGRKSQAYINFMKILLDSLEFFHDGKLAISSIDSESVKKWNIAVDDMDGAVDYLRDIDDVEVAVFIKQKDLGLYKCSMRSKGKIEVNGISKFFSGGGHKFAAGFDIKAKSLGETKAKILDKIKEVFDK